MAKPMKNAYSSATTKAGISQKTWRITGGAAIAVCAAMTVFSSWIVAPGVPPMVMLFYWSIWFLFLLVALFCVLLDIRHIRAQFSVSQRSLFHETLGEESFRAALIQAQKEWQEEQAAQKNGTPPRNPQ